MLFRFLGVAFAVMGAMSQPVAADDRERAFNRIAKQFEEKAEIVGNEAHRRKTPHVGTMFNEFRLQEFMCGSLAYLFGKDDIFTRLTHVDEPLLKPRMTEEDLNILGIDVIVFSNRARAAQAALANSPRDRVELWNLNCVGQHEIGRQHAMARIAPKATFERHGDQVSVLGDIDAGFFERFRIFVEASRGVTTIVLGSGGGSVRDAILTGLFIRKAGLKTTLFADCYSACPLIFLGGVERSIWSPYPRLGFHQVSAEVRPIPLDHEIYTLIANYARSMGANGTHVLSLMHRSKPTEINYPEVWSLCTVGITTWVQRAC